MRTGDGIPGLNSPELTETVLSNYAEGKGPFTPSDSARVLSVFRGIVSRLERAEGHLFDVCLQDDGQAFSEAERYLSEQRPDLKERLDEHDGRPDIDTITLTRKEVSAIMLGYPAPDFFEAFARLGLYFDGKPIDAKSFEEYRKAIRAKTEPTCKSCVFSLLGTQGDPNEGLCRRHPPQMVLAVSMETAGPLWPEVTADDWCGEHKGAAGGKEKGA